MRSIIQICLLLVAIPACGVDSASNPAACDDPATSEAGSPVAVQTAPDDLFPLPGEATTSTSGCNSVIWCDEPGSSGTVCKQTGCTLNAAIAECFGDLSAIGCSFHCPGRIIGLDGRSHQICCPGVCEVGCPC